MKLRRMRGLIGEAEFWLRFGAWQEEGSLVRSAREWLDNVLASAMLDQVRAATLWCHPPVTTGPAESDERQIIAAE